MQVLKFNNQAVDTDEKTAIGINFQGFDIKNPSQLKVKVSNSFTIPTTTKNLKIIGHAGNPASVDLTVYDTLRCDYTVSNYHLIENGKVQINYVDDRINCTAFEKPTIWEQLGLMSWSEFQDELITWLKSKGRLTGASSYSELIDAYANTTTDVTLQMYFSNFLFYKTRETEDKILLQDDTIQDENGGHFSVYINTIFEFIEDYFDVDFGVNRSFDYNVFQDSFVQKAYTPIRNLALTRDGSNYDFEYREAIFLPHKEILKDRSKETLLTFVRLFFATFNCLIDNVNNKYYIRRFDNINNAEVVRWDSGLSTKTPKFTPIVKGVKQKQTIIFDKVAEGVDPLTNAKTITCNNKNVDSGGLDQNLFKLNAYLPALYDNCFNLELSESFEKHIIFIRSDDNYNVDISATVNGSATSYNKTLNKAALYSLSSEYNTYQTLVNYPVVYDIEKWFTLNEMLELEFFKKYYIPRLGGYYFLNKISGYNPISNNATKINLIKIPQ